jgi:hypothetical protein
MAATLGNRILESRIDNKFAKILDAPAAAPAGVLPVLAQPLAQGTAINGASANTSATGLPSGSSPAVQGSMMGIGASVAGLGAGSAGSHLQPSIPGAQGSIADAPSAPGLHENNRLKSNPFAVKKRGNDGTDTPLTNKFPRGM